jgi:hypothetical protein
MEEEEGEKNKTAEGGPADRRPRKPAAKGGRNGHRGRARGRGGPTEAGLGTPKPTATPGHCGKGCAMCQTVPKTWSQNVVVKP